MGEVLNNGVYLPDRGERNAYDGLKGNWNTLDSIAGKMPGYDGHISDTDIHVTAADKQTWNGKADASHVHNANDVTTGVFDAARIPNLDASKITTGTIDIDRLPQGALERLVKVADQAARYALTAADVQLGDTVQQLDTGVMYVVTDETKLDSADGYTEYTAGSATSVPWSGVTGKPADYTPASHSHGNITNDGKVGTTANKPLITGTGGVVQAGSFGNSANTFCEGNDSRLSDARTPVAHTHVTADVTDFPDMALYPYKLAYTDNGGNFPYINLADSDHIALGFNGITDTGIYKVRATADVPGTPNALTLDGILIVFNSDGTANVSSHRRCQQIFYQNSTTPKIFKRIGVFNITSQTWNWDTYKWVEYANTGRDFIPNETNSLNIGSSSYQWNNLYAKKVNTQSVNGVNPGALSLPDSASFVDISGSITNLDGTDNFYTPSVNGWISVCVGNNSSSLSMYCDRNNSWGASFAPTNTNTIFGILPLVAGNRVRIRTVCGALIYARFYPCLGNV